MERPIVPNQTITKKYILDNISEVTIFSHYLNISEAEIETCLRYNKTIISPFRTKDTAPSVGFYYGAFGRVYCQDFGGSFHGDCFEAVAWAKSIILPLNGERMNTILDTINRDLNYLSNTYSVSLSPNCNLDRRPKQYKEFAIRARSWNGYDNDYWGKRGITKDILNYHRVIPIQQFFIGDKCEYLYKVTDPAYAYYWGKKNGQEQYTVYWPLRKKGTLPRFKSNCNIIQGGKLIKEHKYGIITKSYKDVMFLSNYIEQYDIQAIAPPSESQILTQIQFDYLKTKWNTIFTLTDFDYEGIRFAWRMRKKYGTLPLFLTNGKFNTINFTAKDSTDYVFKFKKKKFDDLVQWFFSNGYESFKSPEFTTFCKGLGHIKPSELGDFPFI